MYAQMKGYSSYVNEIYNGLQKHQTKKLQMFTYIFPSKTGQKGAKRGGAKGQLFFNLLHIVVYAQERYCLYNLKV